MCGLYIIIEYMGEENAKRKEGRKGKEKRIKNTTTYNGVT